mgnify:CR=1 FL=1
MSTRGVIARVFRSIAIGIASGLAYYLVYAVAVPLLLSAASQAQIRIEVPSPHYLCFFIALGVAESAIGRHPASIPLRIATKLLGVLVLLSILSGGRLSGVVTTSGRVVEVLVDISPLIYAILLASFIHGILDAINCFYKLS